MNERVVDEAVKLLQLAGADADDADRLRVTGPPIVLESSFDVTTAAASLVAAATSAVVAVAGERSAEAAGRRGLIGSVTIDTAHACAAFRSERHLTVAGRRQAVAGGPPGGYHPARDGMIQFHTNFAHHRHAVLRTLGLGSGAPDADIGRAARDRGSVELEEAVIGQGGVAAALRSGDEWREHAHHAHARDTPPLKLATIPGPPRPLSPAPAARPLAGLRVLDLTRVIAGPVCARTLAAYGADVLRVGADDLPVIESLLPDSTLGKRFCHLDLATAEGRSRLLALTAEADVVVTGFRPGALAGLGLDDATLREANGSIVIAELSAFGTTGPWGNRRGFDSITQTATGVVHRETSHFGAGTTRPLPCQLLDHGSGFLLALGVLEGLLRRHRVGGGQKVEVSLLATRYWLESLGVVDGRPSVPFDPAPYVVERATPFGRIEHVTHPGHIEGVDARWDRGPRLPGSDAAEWLPTSE